MTARRATSDLEPGRLGAPGAQPDGDDPADRYLSLLKGCLSRSLFAEPGRARVFGWARHVAHGWRRPPRPGTALILRHLLRHGVEVIPRIGAVEPENARSLAPARWQQPLYALLARLLGRRLLHLTRSSSDQSMPFDPISPHIRGVRRRVLEARQTSRLFGLDWPSDAETMVGLRRLDHVDQCVRDVVDRGVPGDLIEAGVWRGGVTILMRGVLAALGDEQRKVWVADSFAGLPKSSPGLAVREPDYTRHSALAVSVESVQTNFRRYGLLDDRVRFLVGWFHESLPVAPIDALAIIRLDGDLYESTRDALEALYPKLSVGGYVIVDDYGLLRGCRRAVDEYRAAHGITDPIRPIDWTGVYWQRTA